MECGCGMTGCDSNIDYRFLSTDLQELDRLYFGAKVTDNATMGGDGSLK